MICVWCGVMMPEITPTEPGILREWCHPGPCVEPYQRADSLTMLERLLEEKRKPCLLSS